MHRNIAEQFPGNLQNNSGTGKICELRLHDIRMQQNITRHFLFNRMVIRHDHIHAIFLGTRKCFEALHAVIDSNDQLVSLLMRKRYRLCGKPVSFLEAVRDIVAVCDAETVENVLHQCGGTDPIRIIVSGNEYLLCVFLCAHQSAADKIQVLTSRIPQIFRGIQ